MKIKHLLLALLLAALLPWAAMAQTPNLYTSYTATAGITDYVLEGYPYLVDNDINTKWCVGGFSGPNNLGLYIEFQSEEPIIPTSYVLTTANDNATWTGRNPKDWTIKAKANPNDAWTTIATVTNDQVLQDVNFTNFAFTVNNPNLASYQYFRFDVSAIQSGGCFQLAELRFMVVDPLSELLYFTDFESQCDWTLVNGNLTNKWTWGTAAHNGTGTHGLYISNDGGTTNAYTNTSEAMVYAYKTLDFEAGIYGISYDWKANGHGYSDYLRVALVPATVNLQAGTALPSGFNYNVLPEGWIAVDGGSRLCMATDWQTASYDVNVPTAGQYKIVFAWRNDDYYGPNPPAAIDNVSIEAVTCPTPHNFTVGEVNATTADLSWSASMPIDSYTVNYRTAQSVDGTNVWQTATVAGNSTEVSTTLTGLTHDTPYEAFVYPDCNPNKMSDTVRFSTKASLPYTTDFENQCDWQFVNGNLTNKWCWGSAVHNGTGSSSIYISNNGGTSNSYNYTDNNDTDNMVYAYKSFHFEAGVHYFQYDWRASGESNWDYLRVALVPSSAALYAHTVPYGFGSSTLPTEWIALDGGSQLNGSTAWQTMGNEIMVPTEGNYNIVFAWCNNYNTQGSNPPAAIDNVIVEVVSCPTPANLSVAATTATTTTLEWTEYGTPTNWQICLNDDETNLIEADSNPFTLTGLTTNLFYTAKVRANCGDEQSGWSNSVTFTATDKTIVGSGTGKNDFLPCDNYARYCVTQQIYTPADLDGAGKILSLDFFKDDTKNCTRSLSIYMTHTTKNAFESNTDWIPVTVDNRVFYGTVNFADNAWTTITLNTPFNYNGIDNLALVVDDNTGSASSITYFKSYVASPSLNQSIYKFSDESDIDPTGTIGPCYPLFPSPNKSQMLVGKTYPTPSPISSSTVRYTTAFLSWTEYGTATSWQICIDNDETNLIEVTDNPFCIKTLSPGTTYTAKVRSTYGDEHTDWSEPMSFTTLAAIEVPYSTSFSEHSYAINSSNWLDKWIIVSGMTPQCFNDSEHHPHSTNRCLYFPNASTLGGELPVIAMPYFADNIGNYTLEFWAYLGDYPYIGGTLEVGFLTDLYDASTFMPVRAIDYDYYAEHAQSNENDYAKVSVNFENVPDRAYIAFRGTVESGHCYWCVDDVSVTVVSNDYPTDLTFQNITATSAELHWNGPLNADAYGIRMDEREKNLFEEHFDNPSAPHCDYNWTIVNGQQYTGVSWSVLDNEGEFYFGYLSTTTQYLISPELTGIQDDMHLLFNFYKYTGSAGIQVGYSSTDMDTTSFTFGPQHTVGGFDEPIPPGTKYFCIKALPGIRVIIDNIIVGYPDNFIYIDVEGSHTEQYYYVNNDHFYHNIFTLTGLKPDYEYDIQIYSTINGQNYWSSPRRFRTQLDFYSTDFDSICDWTLINGSCANAWSWGTAASNGGTHGLYISNDGGTSNAYTNTRSAMVYATKTLDFEAGAYHFSFDWKANGQSSYDYLRVALVPAAVNLQAGTSKPSGFGVATLPTGWIALDGGSKLNSSTEWQTVGNDIMVPTDGTYKMVLAWWNNSSGGSNPPAAIDNVSICNIACPKPFNLTVGELSPTTASLHWDGPATTGSYTIRYKVVGTYIWQTKTVEGGSTHVTGAITGLTPETQYEAQVQSDCDYAPWSETVSFTTEAYDYLLDSDFDTVCEWTLINGSCANAWAWGNAAGNNSTNGLYISYDGGVTYACNYWEPSAVYAASNTLALEDGWYHFSYDYRCDMNGECIYMRAALVPASVQLEAGVQPDGLGRYSLPSGWIPLDGGQRLFSGNDWYSFNTDVYVPATDNYRVVCVWNNCSKNIQSSYLPGAVDNFKAYALPCATPFNVTVNNVTSTTAELNWTGTTGMDSYTVRYRPYANSQPVMEESFENGHDDWTLITDGSSGWTQYLSHSGQWSFHFYFNTDNTRYLITPELSDITEGMKLEFYVKNLYLERPNHFYVGFSSTDDATGSFAFGDQITAPGADWNLYSFDIPAGTKYICISCVYSGTYWNELFFDDIYAGVMSPEQAWQTMAVEGNAIDMGATLTGLIPDTRYEVQVKTGCEAGEWTKSLIFTTPYGSLTKEIAGYGTGSGNWYLIATPFAADINPTDVTNMTNGNYDLYRFSPTHEDNEWENYKDMPYDLINGQGYLYAHDADVTLTFSGTPVASNSPVEVPLTYDADDDQKCWNLVGNPFDGKAYLNREYYVLNADGTGINPVAVPANTPIQPCTAVFVKATAAGQTVVFTKVVP